MASTERAVLAENTPLAISKWALYGAIVGPTTGPLARVSRIKAGNLRRP
jgi:hypothetical protein